MRNTIEKLGTSQARSLRPLTMKGDAHTSKESLQLRLGTNIGQLQERNYRLHASRNVHKYLDTSETYIYLNDDSFRSRIVCYDQRLGPGRLRHFGRL